MSKHRIWRVVGIVVVVVLQILMCNRIALWGVATPFVLMYLFLKVPSGLNAHLFMTFAFFCGSSCRYIYQYPGSLCLGFGNGGIPS